MFWNEIQKKAKEYRMDMAKFLSDLVKIHSISCKEKDVVLRIKKEMEKVGFDEIIIDGLGNILGRVGNGPRVIAIDAHIDTVDLGERSAWNRDPLSGDIDDVNVYGRGTTDQTGGLVSGVYAGKIVKDLNLGEDVTVWVTGTVMEEDCDGLCWQYILNEVKLRPEFVVITEPTNLNIYRGHRGRMEIKVYVKGLSAHGSAPERGDNAIFKMAKILNELEELHPKLKNDDFLGKGSLTVSQFFSSSPSQCAVADEAWISIDRRLTWGETKESAIGEIEALPSVKKFGAKVEMYMYSETAYTGLVYPTEKYYPTWKIEENHPLVQQCVSAFENLFDKKPVVDKWTFSTNGVSIMGREGIPCIGFGPGNEIYAHAPNEFVPIEHLEVCAAFYAGLIATTKK
ncbi:YgeY family selenium metabolism-linked hydrolase [bacterium]|nr:YgeY family selenium metabolism-linked hydrolase [bacterium]